MLLVSWLSYLAKHCRLKKFCIVDCKWTGDNLCGCERLRPDLNMFEIHWYEDSHIKNIYFVWHLNFDIEIPSHFRDLRNYNGETCRQGHSIFILRNTYCASEFIGYRYVNCRNERFIAARQSVAGPHMNKLQHLQERFVTGPCSELVFLCKIDYIKLYIFM